MNKSHVFGLSSRGLPRALAMALMAALVLAGPASARADAVAECDRLASSPAASDKVGAGVPFARLEAAPAVAACEAAVAQQPEQGRLHFELGRALQKLERFDEAQHAYRQAGELGYGLGWINLGVLYDEGIGTPPDIGKAMQAYAKGVEAGETLAYYNLGTIHLYGRAGEPDYVQARELLTVAAEKGDSDAQINLAIIYQYGLGLPADSPAAERWYKSADASGSLVARSNLAWLWGLDGRNLDEAEAYMLQVLEEEPEVAANHDTLGLVRLKAGRYEEALADFQKAVELDPEFAPYHARLGDAFVALGRKDEAGTAWKAALDLPEPEGLDAVLNAWDRAEIAQKLAAL